MASMNARNIVLPPVHEPRSMMTIDRYSDFDRDPLMFWNTVALRLNRITTTLGGPQGGPTMSSRALGLVHLAMHDAYFRVAPHADWTPYLDGDPDLPAAPSGADPADAMAGAAHAMLVTLYGGTSPDYPDDVAAAFDAEIAASLQDYIDILKRGSQPHPDSLRLGADIANVIFRRLGVKDDEIGAGDTLPGRPQWKPRDGRFEFRDEPSHPVRLRPSNPKDENSPQVARRIYHGPYYGYTVQAFAMTRRHYAADPPFERTPAETAEYQQAFDQVYELGGAATLSTTRRTPDQTVAGTYWAYDGVNLLGTPPRLYNQILRVVANDQRVDKMNVTAADTADFVRLFALCNVAMADAGLVAWQEKYRYRYWRPLSGVREHDPSTGPGDHPGAPALAASADPFWRTLGAPATNTNEDAFKPPFPAYPSGHATFGGAAFQCARRFYKDRRPNMHFDIDKADEIGFVFVSEELDGLSRHLDQPYRADVDIALQPGLVNTRVVRKFESLWRAMFENGASRVYLGVHWLFDAFSRADVMDGDRFKNPAAIEYKSLRGSTVEGVDGEDLSQRRLPIGGVPLGIAIGDDIYGAGLKPANLPPPSAPGAAPASPAGLRPALKTQFHIR